MSKIAKEFGIDKALKALGIQQSNDGTSTGFKSFCSGEFIESRSPVDDAPIAKVSTTSEKDYEKVMSAATEAFGSWRKKPAPQRGEIVRQFGEKIA